MEEVKLIHIDEITTNRYQPRLTFDDDALADLALSIKHNGLLQPIVVRAVDDHYEIIAGERRFRACKLNGFTEVPCIIKDATELQSAELALIENIQRQDLSAIEEAKAYVSLMRSSSMTQEELARKLGKSQATIANKIRLLQLPDEIQNAVSDGKLTERHARALLGVEKDEQSKVYHAILKKGLNVKKTEDYIKKLKEPKVSKPKSVITGVSKSLKIAINTIDQAVKMINQSGVKATIEGYNEEDEVRIVIRMPK